jgi:hypothetical protein
LLSVKNDTFYITSNRYKGKKRQQLYRKAMEKYLNDGTSAYEVLIWDVVQPLIGSAPDCRPTAPASKLESPWPPANCPFLSGCHFRWRNAGKAADEQNANRASCQP